MRRSLTTFGCVAVIGCGRYDFETDAVSADAPPGYSDVVLADQPLSYWRFGETMGTFAHDEVGAEPGTYASVTLDQPGATSDGNPAIAFTVAKCSEVTIGDVYGFPATAPFSLEVWVQPASFDVGGGGANIMFDKSAITDGFSLYLDNGAPLLRRCSSGGTCDDAMSTPLALGAWSHVVGTYDGVKLQLYVNGGIVAQLASARALTGTPGAAFVIGCFSAGGSGFDGNLDEAAVYGRALSPDRILAHCVAAHDPSVTCAP